MGRIGEMFKSNFSCHRTQPLYTFDGGSPADYRSESERRKKFNGKQHIGNRDLQSLIKFED